MLLAIDVGNSHTVFGVLDGTSWSAVWRRATRLDDTADQLAAWIHAMFEISGIRMTASGAVVCSVVPALNDEIREVCLGRLGVAPIFVEACEDLGIAIEYEPPSAVGADRLANALGALSKYAPPIVIVDFGTATTFDVVSSSGSYIGGSILPGVVLSGQALVERTAKLPQFEYKPPARAIGRSTAESLQSGIILGYAGAIDSMASRICGELGERATVIATGGLGSLFVDLCEMIERHEPELTLDGLAIAYDRLMSKGGNTAR